MYWNTLDIEKYNTTNIYRLGKWEKTCTGIIPITAA